MPDPAISINRMTERVLAAHPPLHSVSLQFEQCHVRVNSNDGELVEKLRAYYEGFVAPAAAPTAVVNVIEASPPVVQCAFTPQPPKPDKTELKEEFHDVSDGRIVRKVRTGMMFFYNARTHLVVGPCKRNLNQVINFVNQQHIAWGLDRQRLLLHAAGICNGRHGLAIAGLSGVGKSTLALHLLGRGLRFVSNDRLMVARDGGGLSMHGLAKMPRVNPGTLLHNPQLAQLVPEAKRRELEQLPRQELWDLEEKHDVPIGRVYGPERFVLESRLRGLVVLTWERTAEPPVIREHLLRERHDLLPTMMKAPGIFYMRTGAPGTFSHVVEDYLELLGEWPVLEISGGVSFIDATDECIAFLRRHVTHDALPALDEKNERDRFGWE